MTDDRTLCPRCGSPGRQLCEKPLLAGKVSWTCRCGRLWLVPVADRSPIVETLRAEAAELSESLAYLAHRLSVHTAAVEVLPDTSPADLERLQAVSTIAHRASVLAIKMTLTILASPALGVPPTDRRPRSTEPATTGQRGPIAAPMPRPTPAPSLCAGASLARPGCPTVAERAASGNWVSSRLPRSPDALLSLEVAHR